jgi:hypothetical protein
MKKPGGTGGPPKVSNGNAATNAAAKGGAGIGIGILGKAGGASSNNNNNKLRGSAPPLRAVTMNHPTAIAALLAKTVPQREEVVRDLFQQVLGQTSIVGPAVTKLSQPHAASTTRERGGAAADLALVARELHDVDFVLKRCGILHEMQRNLFAEGIDVFLQRLAPPLTKEQQQQQQQQQQLLFDTADTNSNDGSGPNEISHSTSVGLKPSRSAVSLVSLDSTTGGGGGGTGTTGGDAATTTANSIGTDTKRGKTTPPAAREGCLLLLRALCEICQRQAEPYVIGAFFAAALDETCSANSAVREAAQDAATAMVALAHAWTFPTIICPLLLQSLETSSEWRLKAHALDRLAQCATHTAPAQVYKLIPTLIPALTKQVWDTKAQVSKAARAALLAVCETNANADIRKAIPSVVNAICKPSETNKAISDLMGTTFIVPVDAPTLAILCPVLARGLKEKMAIHKRAACLVISNMSKLVHEPQAVAPFGSLLIPELQKVSEHVQFEEIRDEALKALASLTKALGDSYKTILAKEQQQQQQNANNGNGGDLLVDGIDKIQLADEMAAETARVEAEQERIKQQRDAQAEKDAAIAQREAEEKKKFKEAMDAQRELDRIAAQEAEDKRREDEVKRELLKQSTKGATGKCQGCGLKKCTKTCPLRG